MGSSQPSLILMLAFRKIPFELNALSQARRLQECSFLSRDMWREMAGCSILYQGPLLQGELFECIAWKTLASRIDSAEGPIQH